jgi:hypothetical protein
MTVFFDHPPFDVTECLTEAVFFQTTFSPREI